VAWREFGRVLVTGGAGFIGSHLCERAIEEGCEAVYCLDDFSGGSIWNVRHLLDFSGFKLVEGSVLDRRLVSDLVGRVDVVFHLAAQIHVDRSYVEPELTWRVNTLGTQNVLEAARFHDSAMVLFASSSEVYGSAQVVPMPESHPLDAPHPYGASKIAADRLCFSYVRTYHLPVQIVRCFNVFGPRQRSLNYAGVIAKWVRRVLLGLPPVIYGSGSQTRDYMYVSDAVAAYDFMMGHPELFGRPVNFGSGVEVSIRDLAELIISVCGADVRPVFDAPRLAEVDRLVADTSFARSLGWAPEVSLEEGLRRFVDWYRRFGFEERVVL